MLRGLQLRAELADGGRHPQGQGHQDGDGHEERQVAARQAEPAGTHAVPFAVSQIWTNRDTSSSAAGITPA